MIRKLNMEVKPFILKIFCTGFESVFPNYQFILFERSAMAFKIKNEFMITQIYFIYDENWL